MLLQTLESRLLLAADPTFQLTSKGTLIIHGSAAADEIVVQLKHDEAAGGVQVFVTLDKNSGSSPRQEYDSAFKKIKRFYIDAGGGDDFINISGGSQMTRPATILGGAGDDLIGYSPDAPTLVVGGAGNDQITGAPSVDATSSKNSIVLDAAFAAGNSTSPATLLGGAGDDTLSGDTNDQIDGGAGDDTATLIVFGSNVSDDRRNALAEDYYARLHTTSVEKPEGTAPPAFSLA